MAYYGSDNVNGHSLWLTFWNVLDHLSMFGFKVHGAILDGSSNNRQFTRIVVDPSVARLNKYTATNIFDLTCRISIIQDCKHVFKKIRNSLLSSTPYGKRQLCLNGQYIYWSHFQEAYQFNLSGDWKYFKALTREHVYVSSEGKMRNHLATDVLGSNMLDLMKQYQSSLKDRAYCLDSTVELLRNTSILVDFFCNSKSKIYSVDDGRVCQVLKVLSFFHSWEEEYSGFKQQAKFLITRETRQDIDACIYGFLELMKVAQNLKIPLVPGYINSDLIENWFCQHRCLRNGFNQNPTLFQIAGATNSNIITGSVVSTKSNAGVLGTLQSAGVMPPKKKFKKNPK